MAEQLGITTELLDYARWASSPEDEVLRELRLETMRLPGGRAMQVPPEEGRLLGMFVALIGARRVLEIGTFTGYSTLCMARALPQDGRVITCDVFPKWPAIGEPHWRRAGVAERIDVRIGAATEIIAGLRAEESADGSFDLVFIDADKVGYPHYYDQAVALTRPGGLIIIDNTLFLGRVVDLAAQDYDTAAIRRLNTAMANDERVERAVLVMADGITLARKL
ncbi:O-methyltransferase [Saccharopolyspora sp. NPDC002578]